MATTRSFDGTEIAFKQNASRKPGALTTIIAACQGAAFDKFDEVIRTTTATANMDFRGSGASGRPKTKWDASVPAYARDIAAVIDAVKTPAAVVVGYSHTAEGVVHLAITERQKVAALVLIEPALFVSREQLWERVKLADQGHFEEALKLVLSFANPGLTGEQLDEGAKHVLK